MAGGLIATTAAAIVVPAMLPAGAGGAFASKAWAVDRNSDGTVTFTVAEQFSDPAGLQRALRADGVPAFVRVQPLTLIREPGAEVVHAPCVYRIVDVAPEAVQRAAITSVPLPPGQRRARGWWRAQSWTIRPAAMPRGTALFVSGVQGKDIVGFMTPVILGNDKLPACVPVPLPKAPAAAPR
jgi:hypothetical protein